MNPVSRFALQILLFASGPFYNYPWKPIINAIIGHSYEVALTHFKRGHYGAVNLALHGVCLVIQVLGNFALLRRLDQKLLGVTPGNNTYGTISFVTAALWVLSLLASSAPKSISVLSTGVIAAAYVASAGLTIAQYEALSCGGLVAALVLANVMAPARKKVPWGKVAMVVAGAGAWYNLWAFAQQSFWGVYWPIENPILLATSTFFSVLSLVKNPLKPIVIGGMLLGKLAGIGIGSEILVFHSYAFFASFCQGVTHAITKEEATLLALQRDSEDDKIRSEFAHVNYFPNIFLQTVIDFIKG